jgi:hypothetical protein
MRLTSTGLGIGTSSPGYKLDVIGLSNFSKTKSGTGVESYDLITLRLNGTNAIGDSSNIVWYSGGTKTAGISGIAGADNIVYGSLAFSVRRFTTDTYDEAMRIDNRGNLGIGTSSPSNKLDVAGSVGVNTNSVLASTTFTTSTTTANQIIYSMPTATYRSAKLMVQMTSGTSYQVTELLIIHDGTNAFMTQYGDVATTGTSLGTFDSSITSGNLNLLFTPTNAATTVKLSSSLIVL